MAFCILEQIYDALIVPVAICYEIKNPSERIASWLIKFLFKTLFASQLSQVRINLSQPFSIKVKNKMTNKKMILFQCKKLKNIFSI